MKKPKKYTAEPLGDIKVIADFLPSPSELVFKEDMVKVTPGLSLRSGNHAISAECKKSLA